MSGTLICDEDGLYDPTDFNDRLLLGLKGTMSEAELHFIRARLHRRAAVQGPPRRTADARCRSGWSTTRPARSCSTRIPVCNKPSGTCSPCSPAPARRARPCSSSTPTGCCSRCGCAPAPARASWPGCRCSTGGCCAPCTTPATPARSPTAAAANASPPTARRPTELVPREQWIALIPDAHPGYISWDQYETNQKLLLANATAHGADRAAGPAREGTALLQGLAICGRCGRRMTVRYHTRRGVEVPDYQCMNRCIQDGAPRCQTMPGGAVDAAVGQPAARHPHPARARGRPHRAGRTRHPRRRSRRAAPPPRRTRPPPRRPGPPPLPGRRPRQPARRRQPRSRLERRAARPADRPARTTTAPAPPPQPPSPTSSRTESVPWQQISPPSGPTPTPRSATANAWSASWSTTSPCTRPTASTCTSASAADRPPASPSRSHPQAWQARQTHPDTLAALDRLLDTHTDAQTAEALNAAGHRSGEGKPFTARIVVRHPPQVPSTQPRRPAPRPRPAHHNRDRATPRQCTPAPSRAGPRAGILNSHKANDKNERLYQPPTPGDPRLTARQGSPLRKRVPTQPAPGGAL